MSVNGASCVGATMEGMVSGTKCSGTIVGRVGLQNLYLADQATEHVPQHAMEHMRNNELQELLFPHPIRAIHDAKNLYNDGKSLAGHIRDARHLQNLYLRQPMCNSIGGCTCIPTGTGCIYI